MEVPAQPSMVFEVLGELRLLVLYQTTKNPSDVEWDAYLDAIDATHSQSEQFRFLVVTEGGHPNRDQVTRLVSRSDSQDRVAVVSSSISVRFVLSIIALANSNIRSFLPAQRHAMHGHLGISRDQVATIDASIEGLRRSLKQTQTTAA